MHQTHTGSKKGYGQEQWDTFIGQNNNNFSFDI